MHIKKLFRIERKISEGNNNQSLSKMLTFHVDF